MVPLRQPDWDVSSELSLVALILSLQRRRGY
jgi:hypothetical protein